MGQLKILTLVGGIAKDSLNQKLTRAFSTYVGAGAEFKNFDLTALPYFSQDLEEDPPKVVADFKKEIQSASSILFVTPEYNRSIPGVLKNAIDWGSRPYGQSVWAKKNAGIIGASIGNSGTMAAQHHLRQVLSYLDLRVLNQPEFFLNGSKAFKDDGTFNDETLPLVRKYWDAFKAWSEQVSRT